MEKLKAALRRFAKATIAGAVGGMVLAVQALGPAAAVADWRVYASAALFGAITGVIMAAEKFLTWDEQPA